MPAPRLSWQLRFAERGAVQGAYEIQVFRPDVAGPRLLWDSGRVESDRSLDVAYGGPPLGPGERCLWRVRAWDAEGRPSAWSDEAIFETGLLSPADWTARWISPGWDDNPAASPPAPLLRREFRLAGPVRSARLYVTSLGLNLSEINGHPVGDQVLSPGWSEYDRRIEYQTYDVTGLLREGANAIGVTLGDGRYRGNLGTAGQRNVYGSRLALLAELKVVLADGSAVTLGTDASWRASTGPILASDIYNGETYDARRERDGGRRRATTNAAGRRCGSSRRRRPGSSPRSALRSAAARSSFPLRSSARPPAR